MLTSNFTMHCSCCARYINQLGDIWCNGWETNMRWICKDFRIFSNFDCFLGEEQPRTSSRFEPSACCSSLHRTLDVSSFLYLWQIHCLCFFYFFATSCFWAASYSFSSVVTTAWPLPLTASKCDIILRAECRLPFSHVFSESQSSVKC